MESALAIATGVVSGVITAALLWVFVALFRDRFLPFWAARQYQGLDLSGSWNAVTITATEDLELNLVLAQKAHDLTGSLRITFKSPGNSYEMDHVVTGKLWEGYLTLTMKPVLRHITSFGTAMMKVSGGGGVLAGKLLYRNVNEESVDSMAFDLYLESAATVRAWATVAHGRAAEAGADGADLRPVLAPGARPQQD